MGNITTSFTISSPGTICHRAFSWAARKLRLRNFQITDNNRGLIRTTIAIDRAREPADALRQQLRERIEEHPGTMAVSWTSRDEITTALSMNVQRVWPVATQRGTNVSQLYSSPITIAHAGEAHLFLGETGDLNHPSLTWKNPNWKTQPWLNCVKIILDPKQP